MSRKHGLPIALALSMFVVLFVPAAAFAGGDANFILGSKRVDREDWGLLDHQGVFGAEVTFGKQSWPVWIALDYFASGDEEQNLTINVNGSLSHQDVTGSTVELDLGLRKIWGKHKTRPFLGGGIGAIGARIDANIVDDESTTLGYWAGGGVFWRLGSRFNIGGTVRWSTADVEVLGNDIQAGGVTYGLLLGWGWPAHS